ncbi:hypothetical protein C8N35_10299 [Breoghania corrubedonensis]|uniref:Uncharacterized protein n=1 Tax=Breoghania corrubedonensis TaxID=665038 RepID=A0A2T5VCA8_9HYPH|nr:hypothetical protein C8N35_10299 [Breoghania corrubedonensis]
MSTHPCLSCQLPDCDESDRRCALKKALREYSYRSKQNLPISDELRGTYTLAYAEIYGSGRNRSGVATS